jgi:multiple sugar transport system permease protein
MSRAMSEGLARIEQPALPGAPHGRHAADEARILGRRFTWPAQLLLIFIVAFPFVMQLYISLTDWTPLQGGDWWHAYALWNRFANYTTAATDARLWSALGRTLLIVAVCVPIELLLGFGLALLFVDDFPGKRVAYSVMLLPMMVVPAVTGYMFYMLFQSDGPVNDLLSSVLGQRFDSAWLSDTRLAMVAVMAADIWQWTPLMFLILLSGLIGVPEDQLKAAALLGASWTFRFRTIVLPRMRTVLVIAALIRAVEVFKIFDTLYLMTAGGPGVATESISVFFFKITLQDLEWSYAATIALLILVLLSALVAWGMKRMARRQGL